MNKTFKKLKLFFYFLRNLIIRRKITSVVYITNKCNAACRNCYRDKRPREDEADSEEWEKRFRRYHDSGIRHLIILGGEPSLRSEIIEMAGSIFPFITVTTNGTIKLPFKSDIMIHLSLDGPEEIHDKLRGRGIYEKAIENYKNDGRVLVSLTLGKDNYSGPAALEDFIKEMERTGFGGLFVNFLFPQTDKPESYGRILGDKELQDIRRVLLSIKKTNDFILNSCGMIIEQTKPGLNSKECRVPGQLDIYSAEDRRLKKMDETIDCRYCRFLFRFDFPVFDIVNWIQARQARRKILFNV